MCKCEPTTRPGGLALPHDLSERKSFVRELLKRYVPINIEADPVLRYLRDTYAQSNDSRSNQ